jgi:rhodanese-related sulfurtransferase
MDSMPCQASEVLCGRALTMALLLMALLGCSPPAEDGLDATIAWVERRNPNVAQVDAVTVVAADPARLLLVDVRAVEEYTVSHLPGALRWEDVQTTLARIRRQQPDRVILYCSVGERSSRAAAQLLESMPDLNVANLRGGVFAWATAGRPLVDCAGQSTILVHPYDRQWGRLLPAHLRATGSGSER